MKRESHLGQQQLSILTQQSIGEYAWKKTITKTSYHVSHLTDVCLCMSQHVSNISKFISLGVGLSAEPRTATLPRASYLAHYLAHNSD